MEYSRGSSQEKKWKTLKDQAIIDLLWDYLKRDPEHKDRRQTGFGTKTKQGLIASVRRVVNEETR